MQFLGLRTAAYYVTDLAAAKEWYIKVLGVAPYFDAPFYIGFNVGGYELGLQPISTEQPLLLQNQPQVYWGVADVQESCEHLLSLGATLLEGVQDVGDGIQVATVQDPWGNALGIIYNPYFKLP